MGVLEGLESQVGGVEDLHDKPDRVAYVISEESVTPAPPVSRPPMRLKPVADDGARVALGGGNAGMVVVGEDGSFPRRRAMSFEIVGYRSRLLHWHGRWSPQFWRRSCRPSSMARCHGRAWVDCTARARGPGP